MKRAVLGLLITVFAAGLTSPAVAALVSYELLFVDSTGATVGNGHLRFDGAVKEDIYLDMEQGDRCDPLGDPDFCTLRAQWTPIELLVTLFGEEWTGEQTNFLEGHLQFPTRSTLGGIESGLWAARDSSTGFGWLIQLGDLSGALFWELYGDSRPDSPDGYASGLVFFTRVSEVPIPAAAWLFLAGAGALVGGIGGRKRRSDWDQSPTK